MTERLGVVGSGTIACGLAVAASRRAPLTLWARSDASAARAERLVAKACAKLADGHDPARVTVATGLDGLEDHTFVIEAVAEDAAVKRTVLGDVVARIDGRAILGTTTSSLSISALADSAGRPDRFVGFHVFNPVPRMPLVELAFPEPATAATRERARTLCALLDKQPVEVPDRAGFVVNRLLFPYLFDAVRLAEETGLPPEDLDACMTLGAGHPTGPLALLDYVGLDVAQAIGESLGVEVPEAIRRLVAEGALGRKAGRGLYDYS